jgi:hypothetical protein
MELHREVIWIKHQKYPIAHTKHTAMPYEISLKLISQWMILHGLTLHCPWSQSSHSSLNAVCTLGLLNHTDISQDTPYTICTHITRINAL